MLPESLGPGAGVQGAVRTIPQSTTPGTGLNFKLKSKHELARLKDEELIAYAVAARDAGEQAEFQEALKQFVASRIGLVDYWVGSKVGANDRDEVVGNAMVSIIKSVGNFKGSSAGEFVEWMRSITRRRIADHYRDSKKDPGSVPIDEQAADEEDWGPVLGEPDETGSVEVRMVIEEQIKARNAVQQEVIRLRIAGFSSIETAENCCDEKMTATNVDKIFSRFRKDVEKELWGEP